MTTIHAAFRGIPPPLNRIWRTRKGSWRKAGAAFANEIQNNHPHGVDPQEWKDSLAAAIQYVNVTDPGTSCKIVRNWLNIHYPDLMDTISEEQATAFAEGLEDMV